MSINGHCVTGVKLGYIPSTPFINEPPFTWQNFKLPSLSKFLEGPLQREGGQTINDEDKNSKSVIFQIYLFLFLLRCK